MKSGFFGRYQREAGVRATSMCIRTSKRQKLPRCDIFLLPMLDPSSITLRPTTTGHLRAETNCPVESEHPQGSTDHAPAGPSQHRKTHRLFRIAAILLHRPGTLPRRRTVPPNRSPDVLFRGPFPTHHHPGRKGPSVSARRGRCCAPVRTLAALPRGLLTSYDSDIKPENLLFYPTPFVPTRNPKPKGPDDEDKADEGEFVKGKGAGGIGLIKIADFGLSKVVWDSQTMTPCGTVGYTAPEIVKDERYSKSVDMWALGCVLYTLLCGFPPFYDESIQTLTEKVARGQYTFLSPWWDEISKPAQDLVSHLLTVDPEKRYDINQFLEHPWIREADEPTYSAFDAPPLATPAATKERLQPDFSYLESPGARRMDFRSPGAVNLREVFDVGYAVHRQEEEGKRKKQFKQGYRGANAINSLNALDEGEDDDEYAAESQPYDSSTQHPPAKLPKSQGADVSGMEQKLRNTTLSAAAQARQQQAAPRQQERGYGQHSPAVAAAAKRQVKNKGAFELNLDSSTLLGRRNKKAPEPSGLRNNISVGGT
jgi:serine/threonine protein kinase